MLTKCKKTILLTLIFVFAFQAFGFSAATNRLVVNDKLLPIRQSAVYENYSSLIGSDVVQDKLGFVIWEDKKINCLYILKDNKLLTFQNNQAYLNWDIIKVDSYPKRINGKLYIPASLLKTIFNIPVVWNEKYNFVRLFSNQDAFRSSVFGSVYGSSYNCISDFKIIEKYHKQFIDSINMNNNQTSIDGISAPVNPKKFAYLTFDDGPNPNVTPIVLDTLKKYDLKATFFMLGRYVKAYPELVKRVYNEGHYIGNHSYSHKMQIFRSFETFKYEICKTSDLIYKYTGEYPKLFRAPYGYRMGSSYKNFLSDNGYKIYIWNVDSGDSRGHDVPSEKILNNVVNSLGGKRDIVIIMHDGAGHMKTAQALEGIIKELWKYGFGIKALTPYADVNARVQE